MGMGFIKLAISAIFSVEVFMIQDTGIKFSFWQKLHGTCREQTFVYSPCLFYVKKSLGFVNTPFILVWGLMIQGTCNNLLDFRLVSPA